MNKKCKMANKSYRPINRDCQTCKHRKSDVEQSPCNNCSINTFNNWEPNKTDDKKKDKADK